MLRNDGTLAMFLDAKYIEDRLNAMDLDGNMFSWMGYSDFAILLVITYGVALVAICVLVGAIGRCRMGLPVGGTNSAIINATCHLKPRN